MQKIKNNVKEIIKAIGEDVEREGLKCTPIRVDRMFRTFFYGYRKKLVVMNEDARNNESYATNIIPITVFKCISDEMLIRKVKFISFCEHHIIPFAGEVWVGIIPEKILLGMNKIDKIVKYFAAKLQIQERMGTQIADWIEENIKPKGTIVIIKAKHYCAEIQGDSGDFITSAVRGVFLMPSDPSKSPKQEFLSLVK